MEGEAPAKPKKTVASASRGRYGGTPTLRFVDFPNYRRKSLPSRRIPIIDEVAHSLCLTRNTVKKHLQHIYAKLKVNSLHRALLRAKELGLLDDEPKPQAQDYPKG